jgi:hypothetical protein
MNIKKNKILQSKESSKCFTIRRIFRPRTANTLPPITASVVIRCRNGINVDSAGNYHLMDRESTQGMVILQRIVSS